MVLDLEQQLLNDTFESYAEFDIVDYFTLCYINNIEYNTKYLNSHFLFFYFHFHFVFSGTPSARPILWMVKQVSTEVKKLRDRAERSQDNSNTKNRFAIVKNFSSYNKTQ